jgi:hypothetical protein
MVGSFRLMPYPFKKDTNLGSRMDIEGGDSSSPPVQKQSIPKYTLINKSPVTGKLERQNSEECSENLQTSEKHKIDKSKRQGQKIRKSHCKEAE